jgi:hypothetical protein
MYLINNIIKGITKPNKDNRSIIDAYLTAGVISEYSEAVTILDCGTNSFEAHKTSPFRFM